MEAPVAAVAPHRPTPHVVVCDDAPAMRELLRDLLEDAGYRVSALSSPPALERLRSLGPDVVILDLVFAGAEDAGWAFLRSVGRDPELAGVPVVLCTAALDPAGADGAASAVRPGAVRVVRKPFDIDALLATLADALAERERAAVLDPVQ